MRTLVLGLTIAAMAIPAATPALARDHDRRGGNSHNGRNYDWNRPDPRYGGYDASRYYHPGNYRERRLGRNDRIYRGGDGRYYCRRTDGTTGLIVGGGRDRAARRAGSRPPGSACRSSSTG